MFPNRMGIFSNLAIVRAQSHPLNLILFCDQLFDDREMSEFPFGSTTEIRLQQQRQLGVCTQSETGQWVDP